MVPMGVQNKKLHPSFHRNVAFNLAGAANFEDGENQIEAQRSGFDLERRSDGMSER